MKSCQKRRDFFFNLNCTMKMVAIQGVAGAYHEIAARMYFEGEPGRGNRHSALQTV